MSKRRSNPGRIAAEPPRFGGAWKWLIVAGIAVMVIAGTAVVALKAMHSKPPAGEAVASNAFLATVENQDPPRALPPEGMVWIPGGVFSMGARAPLDMHDTVGMQATTDSRPVHRVAVDGFWMDETEVTNEQFARFVEATG